MLNNQYFAQHPAKSPAPERDLPSNVLEFKPRADSKQNLVKTQDRGCSGETSPTPNKLLRQTIEKMDGAYAISTIRAYGDDFAQFIQYCKNNHQCPLPAEPQAICNYIQSLVTDGRSSASIRRLMSGITTIHKLNRYADPTKDPDVLLEVRRMHRTIGRYSKQALGVTSDILERLLQATEAGNRGARDRALLLLAYDTLCRRSELTALLIEDIKFNESGGLLRASILIRRSKTDQLGQGRRLTLSERGSRALREWLERRRNPNSGQIFMGVDRAQKITQSFGAGQVNRIYKRLATRTGLPEAIVKQISGHSLRVGHAQDMVNGGESLPMIMSKGRWSKTDTVMRYVEHITYTT